MDSRSYIERGMHTVEGWFRRDDAEVFLAVDAEQPDRGDLLEIGVYLGKSAVLVGSMRRPDERFVVCDLFDPATLHRAEAGHYANLTREAFEANYHRFHHDAPDIYAMPSSGLERAANLGRTFRFIHVDGSHEYTPARGDVELVSRLLVPGGVAAFDDILTLHAVGVQAAVWEVVATGALTPFAITPKKLYVSLSQSVDDIREAVAARLLRTPGFTIARHALHSSDVLEVRYHETLPLGQRLKRGLIPPTIARRLNIA